MTEKTAYRLTKDRPIHGRARKDGDTVHLTAAEFAAESVWGGLEPVTIETRADAPAERTEAEEAGEAKPASRRTKG
ncbi:hypothetical protein [Xanthobacter sp. 126]|uniref:hypothetical protein n=1 Tax=Xanthobacter sp. 126 TaxID=1131814 RepID=UPI00045EA11A|nr:hypothetical protein [Xanthobacter sp. 126]